MSATNIALEPSGGSAAGVREDFVLCSLPEICLAVPRTDVAHIEHGTEFSVREVTESAIAWFDSARGSWPVCALDAQLRPCPAWQASGSFLVFLNAHPTPLGLRCESVRILRSGSDFDVHRLPAVMQVSGGGIVLGVARIDRSHLAIVIGESKLSPYLAKFLAREASRE